MTIASDSSSPEPAAPRRRCLLVDDNPGIPGAGRRMVQGHRTPGPGGGARPRRRHPGLAARGPPAGHEAMAHLMVGARVDVVLLDLHMPGASGFTVLEAIRRDPRLAALKVIVMTVDPRHATMADAAHHGDRYLLKPVDAPDLRAHLEAVLGPLP